MNRPAPTVPNPRLRAAVAIVAVLALVAAALAVAAAARAGGTHSKPWVCHPVEGKGETKTGWVLIRPDRASVHIDESLWPSGRYWKHETRDGRHDVYAVQGTCPGGPTATPTPTDPTAPPPTDKPTCPATPTAPPVTPTEPATTPPVTPPATPPAVTPPAVTPPPVVPPKVTPPKTHHPKYARIWFRVVRDCVPHLQAAYVQSHHGVDHWKITRHGTKRTLRAWAIPGRVFRSNHRPTIKITKSVRPRHGCHTTGS